MGDIMREILSNFVLVCSVLLLANVAAAQSAKTEHTFRLDDPATRIPATLEDVALMVVMFKVMGDEGVSFYEIHTYITLHNDEKVWEEKLVYRRTEL